MANPTFTADAFREAQHKLGLSDMQLAAVLGTTAQHIRRMKIRDGAAGGHRPVQPYFARLLQAYLDGYRPADWPL